MRPSPVKSDAAMVFNLPISTSMSDSVIPASKLNFPTLKLCTWIGAPLVAVSVNCSESQVVESVGAKIWITPEILLRYLLAATSRPPFSIAWLVELFRDLAPSLHSQVATLLAKPSHLDTCGLCEICVNGKNIGQEKVGIPHLSLLNSLRASSQRFQNLGNLSPHLRQDQDRCSQ